MLLIVFVSFPSKLIELLHNISLDESHLDEGENGGLNQSEINHLIVSISSDLVENGFTDTISDRVEAVVAEKLER